MGAISPWVFGLVLDWAGSGTPDQQAWGLAWCSVGVGAVLGPLLTWRLHKIFARAARSEGSKVY